MTETAMSTDLLQALQIITKLRIDTVGEDLRVFAVNNIALTIEEPGWDLVLSWVLDDGNDSLQFFGSELTGAISHYQLLLPPHLKFSAYRLLRSTSAFLQTKFE